MDNAANDGFYLKGKDGKDIYVYRWADAANPRAVVQIFHGVAEHAARYARLAKFLNTNGFIVYADDHRGHGKTAGSQAEVGLIGEDGYNHIVEDEYAIHTQIKADHPGLPVFVIGHSFGSFVAQDFISRYGHDIAGVILSGSARIPDTDITFGKIIAVIQKAFLGERKKSHLLTKLSFGSYNRRFAGEDKNFAWLSRDRAEVQKYVDDPYCGTVFSIGYQYYFFKGLSRLYKPQKVARVPKQLPIFIVHGSDDPVGGYGAYVQKLFQMYKGLDISDLECKTYPGARHEIFNEMNRDEVMNDVLSWINIHLGS
jgi:Lysophospholipase